MSVTDTKITEITRDDIPALQALSDSVGWGHTLVDWQVYLAWAGGFAVAIRHEGQIVASGLAVAYSQHARICNVITHPLYQRQGMATAIVNSLRDKLRASGIDALDLDCSDQGKPLYSKLGFEPTGTVEVYRYDVGSLLPVSSAKSDACDLASLVEFDTQAFGSDRHRMLAGIVEDRSNRVWVDEHEGQLRGFAMTMLRDHVVRLGPWEHQTADGAARLLRKVLSAHQDVHILVTIPSSNESARRLLNSHEFERVDIQTRMVFQEPRTPDPSVYYGLLSLAAG